MTLGFFKLEICHFKAIYVIKSKQYKQDMIIYIIVIQ
jgi:hypothetical protein